MARSRSISVTVSFGDLHVELDVSYTPGSPSSYDYPGDGPEIEPGRFVHYSVGDDTEVTTWDNFVLTYAASRAEDLRSSGKLARTGVSVMSLAEDELMSKLLESVEEDARDADDCAREDAGWRDE